MKFFSIVLAMLLCASATWWYWPRKEPPAKTLSIPGPRHRLAPDGTLFLVQGLSVKKPFGIDGLEPGTTVHLVKQTGSHLRVTDGEHQFDVEQTQVTNDLDRADAVRRAYIATQTATNREILSQQKEYAKEKEKEMEEKLLADENARIEQQRKTQAAAVGSTSSLNRGAYHKTDAMHYDYDRYGQRYWLDSLGHRHYAPPSSGQ